MTLWWSTLSAKRRFSKLSKNVIQSIARCIIWSKIKIGNEHRVHFAFLSLSRPISALLAPIHSNIYSNKDHLTISLRWYQCYPVSDSSHKSRWVSIKVWCVSPPIAINSTSSDQNPLFTLVFLLLLLKINPISFKKSLFLGLRVIPALVKHHQRLSSFLVRRGRHHHWINRN